MASLKKPVKAPSAAPAKKPAATKPAAEKTTPAKAAPKKTFPAKKTGTAAKPAVARAPRPTWEAPADMKTGSYDFLFTTDDHGLIDMRTAQGVRIKGKWDNPDAPRYDLREFDINTLMAFYARISAVVFAPNPIRRLPANTTFRLVIRAVVRRADGTLAARIIGASHKSGKKTVWFEDKADPTYRKLRKVARILPSVFVDAQLFPSGRRSKKNQEEADLDE